VALVEIPKEETKENLKLEKKQNENDNTARGEGKAGTKPDLSVNPADEKNSARTEIEIKYAKEIEGFAAQLADRDKLIREFQSAKDKAEARILAMTAEYDAKTADLIKQNQASMTELIKQHNDSAAKSQTQINDLTKCLKDANERNSKLLGGGMAFEPAGPDTWEEAMAACKGDYEVAVKKYPKLRDAFQAKNKRN
jgi:hypothetical protein